MRESRKPESVELARARRHIHRDTETVIGGKKKKNQQETSQAGGGSQASSEEPQGALQEILGRAWKGLEIGCHMGYATQPANANRKLFFQPIYS